jgi:Fe-S-cluster containining protein
MMKKVIRDFECAMCGNCCASQDLVQLTAYELYRLSKFLDVEPAEFFNKYCVVTATSLNPMPHLYIKTTNGACPFLKDQKCSVHEARPYACQAYPMRVYWSLTGDMKAFVRSRYDLEETCSLFKLDDGDVLLGDYDLLARQTIAYWVDEAYFSMAGGEVDLSVPYRVADLYVHDKEMRSVAKRYVVNREHPPTAHDAELAFARISLTLQAAMWNASSAIVDISGQDVGEDERIGKYMLLTTDPESAKALRLLVESGRLDLARTLALESKAYKDKFTIASVQGSSSDQVALGFIFDVEKEKLEALTDGGKKPLYAFFTAEAVEGGKLAGFTLNIKI